MSDLSELQQLAIDAMKANRNRKAWSATVLQELIGGTPASVGMVLKGLYKRGMVRRLPPANGERNASYELVD